MITYSFQHIGKDHFFNGKQFFISDCFALSLNSLEDMTIFLDDVVLNSPTATLYVHKNEKQP